MQITARSPIEEGFAAVIAAEVRPKLLALESQRQTRVKRAFRNIAIALGVTGAIFALIASIWGEDAFFWNFFVGLIGVIGRHASNLRACRRLHVRLQRGQLRPWPDAAAWAAAEL